MRKRNAVAAVMITALILFVLLFSSFYMAAEADHDCSGEDCPVCVVLLQCQQAVKRISGSAPGTAVITLLLISATGIILLPVSDSFISYPTLVSRKIRLDN